MRLLFYLVEASERKKRYLENKLVAWKVQWLSSQILQCTPKLIDREAEVAELYLQALEHVINYKEPQENTVDVSRINTNGSLNNTSIIEDSVNESSMLNNSVLHNSVVSEVPVVDMSKKRAYKVWLDRQPRYAPMDGEEKQYELGKRDGQLSEKL